MATQLATEQLSLDQAAALMAESDRWVGQVLDRLQPHLPSGRLRVLEIGAAQGRALIALHRRGHDACGVEPWPAAIEVATLLADREGAVIDLRKGSAESLPFEAAEFDLVLAFCVMEHVLDLEQTLREIARVLVPGGLFWFYSTSAVCPRQSEIRGFPLFGWYPDTLKKRIMRWAVKNKPRLVGYTDTPALHWWTPRRTHRLLTAAGFSGLIDRWDLCSPDDLRGRSGPVRRILKTQRWLRPVADVLIPDCAYAARRR
jgi:SAM-dependent methyltransferase